MREILFRGKRIDNGEWVEGFYTNLGGKYHYILTGKLDITNGYPDMIKNPVDPSTVGQYTGLTDKNGNRIFEGDIVTITDRFMKSLSWTVEYRKCGFYVKHPLCDYWWELSDLEGYTIEVIGNIHDNPELLKEANP